MCTTLAVSTPDHRSATPCAWPARRWYVAWHPSAPFAVLRAKDTAGLAEWRQREWRLFRHQPMIVDVTHAMAGMLAYFAPPDGKIPIGTDMTARRFAFVVRDDGPDLVSRDPSEPPEDVEADVAADLWLVLGNLRSGVDMMRQHLSYDARSWRRARPGPHVRMLRGIAGMPFEAGARVFRCYQNRLWPLEVEGLKVGDKRREVNTGGAPWDLRSPRRILR